jgi:hypothetical protein
MATASEVIAARGATRLYVAKMQNKKSGAP